MKKCNREAINILDQSILNNLKQATDAASEEERHKAFEAAKAQMSLRDSIKKSDPAFEWGKIADVAVKLAAVGGPIVVAILTCQHQARMTEALVNFEKEGVFTTTPGRSLAKHL